MEWKATKNVPELGLPKKKVEETAQGAADARE
jgi:hypothetical protein